MLSNSAWRLTLWWVCIVVLSCFSHVQLFAALWTVAYQAPLSMRFSRQEYWNGLPFPFQGIFLSQGLNPSLLSLLHCARVLCHWATREALYGEEVWRLLSFIPPARHLQWKTMGKRLSFFSRFKLRDCSNAGRHECLGQLSTTQTSLGFYVLAQGWQIRLSETFLICTEGKIIGKN